MRKLLGTTINGFLMNENYTTTIITKQNEKPDDANCSRNIK